METQTSLMKLFIESDEKKMLQQDVIRQKTITLIARNAEFDVKKKFEGFHKKFYDQKDSQWNGEKILTTSIMDSVHKVGKMLDDIMEISQFQISSIINEDNRLIMMT